MPQSHKVGVTERQSVALDASRVATTRSSAAALAIPCVVPALLCDDAASIDPFFGAAAPSAQTSIRNRFEKTRNAFS